MRIDRFALTTNNITYAAFGDAMNYWNFFPTGDAAWGHMPVWGFADVVASTVEVVAVGERFYGYFPIASHLRMQPVRVTARGFYDGARASRRAGVGLQPVHALQQRRGLRGRARGLPDAGAPALHHLVHAGRFPGRQRLLRRPAGGGVQRLEQDGLRHRVLPGAAPGPAADRRDLARQPGVRRRPGVLRPHPVLRRSDARCRPMCQRCTSTSPATMRCAPPSTTTSATRWCTTAMRARRRRQSF